MMKKVGIIGVGKIGSQLAFNFLNTSFISELYIYNRNRNTLRALTLSMENAALQLKKNILIKEIDFDKINSLDLIVVSVKEFYDPRIKLAQNEYPKWFPKNLRYSGFYDDFPIIKSVVKKIANFNGIVTVITNPVELMTKYIADNIKSKYVFGLGSSLDSSRISYILKKNFDLELDSEKILLFGEHGNSMFTISKLLPNKIKKIIDSGVIEKSNIVGFEIVNKVGYTLFDCIVPFTDDLIWLLRINTKQTLRSFSYPNSGLIISRPITFNNEKNEFISFNTFSEKENTVIKEINTSLMSIYNKLIKE